MNTKPESENFQALRRLLRLKRYEQPPPGYFNGFSRQVIARIQAGESGEAPSLLAQIFGEPSWLPRLWTLFGAKPILAAAFGITICSVLIAGVAYSDRGESGAIPALSPSGTAQAGFAQVAPSVGLAGPVLVSSPGGTDTVISTQERTSLFQQLSPPKSELIMNVAYPARGN